MWPGISYEVSPCLIASPAKLPISLLVVRRLNVFEVGKRSGVQNLPVMLLPGAGAVLAR